MAEAERNCGLPSNSENFELLAADAVVAINNASTKVIARAIPMVFPVPFFSLLLKRLRPLTVAAALKALCLKLGESSSQTFLTVPDLARFGFGARFYPQQAAEGAAGGGVTR